MSMSVRLRAVGVGIAVIALAIGCAAPTSATVATVQTAATEAGQVVPLAIDPDADLGRKDGSAPGWGDSMYISTRVSAGSHRFAIIAHYIRRPGLGVQYQTLNVKDTTTGWQGTTSIDVPEGDLKWASGKLDITTPTGSWTGDSHKQRVTMKTPWGGIDLNLDARGPVLAYAGTGTFTILGVEQFEYALPRMQTTGSVTADGQTYQVTGESWLDRQWGSQADLTQNGHWTWMDFVLDNGDSIGIWDTRTDKAEESWATILHPDGTHELVPVKPLASGATRPWTSPASGRTWATQWTVEIPTRQTRVTVTAVPQEQEINGIGSYYYEGDATVTGTYLGRPITGHTFVEQIGSFK